MCTYRTEPWTVIEDFTKTNQGFIFGFAYFFGEWRIGRDDFYGMFRRTKMGTFGKSACFWTTKNGTSGAQIKILRPLL